MKENPIPVPTYILKEYEKARLAKEEAKKNITWNELESDIEQLFPEHADFVSGMIETDIAQKKTAGYRTSLGTASVVIKDSPSGITGMRTYAEIIDTHDKANEHNTKLVEKGKAYLSHFFEQTYPHPGTVEYFDFLEELGDIKASNDPFVIFYKFLKEGSLPGKKAEEKRLREGLTEEQLHEREQQFLSLNQKIKDKREYEKNLGSLEAYGYALGEDNAAE